MAAKKSFGKVVFGTHPDNLRAPSDPTDISQVEMEDRQCKECGSHFRAAVTNRSAKFCGALCLEKVHGANYGGKKKAQDALLCSLEAED